MAKPRPSWTPERREKTMKALKAAKASARKAQGLPKIGSKEHAAAVLESRRARDRARRERQEEALAALTGTVSKTQARRGHRTSEQPEWKRLYNQRYAARKRAERDAALIAAGLPPGKPYAPRSAATEALKGDSDAVQAKTMAALVPAKPKPKRVHNGGEVDWIPGKGSISMPHLRQGVLVEQRTVAGTSEGRAIQLMEIALEIMKEELSRRR